VALMHTASGITHYAHACNLLEKTYGVLAMPSTIELDDADLDNHSTSTSTVVPPSLMDNPPNVISDSETESE
jgi:hypothetical protein